MTRKRIINPLLQQEYKKNHRSFQGDDFYVHLQSPLFSFESLKVFI